MITMLVLVEYFCPDIKLRSLIERDQKKLTTNGFIHCIIVE